MILWNLIHGCQRKSEGCKHCYVFMRDEQNGIAFHFMQTGGNFYKDGKNYKLTHRLQIAQAARANINILCI